VVGTGRQITAGTCLSGGGDLSADRSLSLAASCSQAQTFSGGIDLAASALAMEVTNDTTTGTTVNKLAKLTGAPSKAIITATTDTAGAVGVVVGGAGTSGSAQIARVGIASCVFDTATTAGGYVQISSTTAGNCHDAGATFPTSGGQVLGRVLSTNGAGGTYAMVLYPGELPIAQTPVSAAVVGSGRTLTASSPLTGGGDLSADRSIGCQTASGSQAGCLSAADWTTFNSRSVALFMSSGNLAASGDCIGNMTTGAASDSTCPAAVPTDTYSADTTYLLGPIPPGGSTVTNLEGITDTAVTGSRTYTYDIVDNTTGTTLLSCTIDTTTSLSTVACRNTGTATATQGHYLQVKVTEGGGAPHKAHRVTFRY
jgi:hypothetical protein